MSSWHVYKHSEPLNLFLTSAGRHASQHMTWVHVKCHVWSVIFFPISSFSISVLNVSRIFTTWGKVLRRFLGKLVFNPPKEVVRANLPPNSKTPLYSSVRHIIDCSEVFIDKTQSVTVSNQCWSYYTHHYTSKFLVSITPAGIINLVSNCWGGIAIDKCITINSGFLGLIEPHDSVMADKGFSSLIDELTLHHANLLVP